jgi:hypothetical protein
MLQAIEETHRENWCYAIELLAFHVQSSQRPQERGVVTVESRPIENVSMMLEPDTLDVERSQVW